MIKKKISSKDKSLMIGGQKICYTMKEHYRAKHLRLSIYPDGRVVATKPKRVSERLMEKFVIGKADWILSQKLAFDEKSYQPFKKDKQKFLTHKQSADNLVRQELESLNKIYHFSYAKVQVRDQKTCWGSCSDKGTLSFNYRLIFLPPYLARYIVAHELCHLKAMNHSSRFWNLVALSTPDYKRLRRELRKIDMNYY